MQSNSSWKTYIYPNWGDGCSKHSKSPTLPALSALISQIPHWETIMKKKISNQASITAKLLESRPLMGLTCPRKADNAQHHPNPQAPSPRGNYSLSPVWSTIKHRTFNCSSPVTGPSYRALCSPKGGRLDNVTPLARTPGINPVTT